MKFHLDLQIPPSPIKIKHGEKIFLTGSCFSENIGKTLSSAGFESFTNSHGILFNPISVARALSDCISLKKYTDQDLILFNKNYCSLNHHGSFSGPDKNAVLDKINKQIETAHNVLKQGQWIFITLGTAWHYNYSETSQTVANCHKIPAQKFTKQLADPQRIFEDFSLLIPQLKSLNNKLNVVFTISPVKYLRWGLFENNIGKSALFLALKKLIDHHPEAAYFPAFELINDDLRDYRFYEKDMAHPNQEAVEYIFEKFSEAYFSDETRMKVKEISAFRNFERHISSNETHQNIVRQKREDLLNKYPEIIL